MKRRMLALLLAVLMLAMLTAAAFAEDTDLGVFNVRGPLTVMSGTQDGNFYTFELNCTGLTGEYSLVLLLEGDSKVPTEGNIQYIDQMSVEGGKVTFTLKPKALTEGTYNIYISTTDKALKKVASFQYGTKPAFELGKVNDDDYIDSRDALLVLQYAAKVDGCELNATQLLAADVNKDGVVDSRDALLILQYAAKLIDTF